MHITSGVRSREIVGFVTVGLVGLIVDVGSFNLGIVLGLRPTMASLLGFVVGATVSFVGNRAFTFTDRHVEHVWRAYALFVGINVVAVSVVQLVVWVGEGWSVSILTLNIVRLLAIAVVTVGRFVAYRRWVFLAREPVQSDSGRSALGVAAAEEAV
jgi:putative flippase GtrA